MDVKYFQWPSNRPNGHKIYQDLPYQDPPKFTKIDIFGLKTNHLATLFVVDVETARWRQKKRQRCSC
jgi:hypothetical protein